MLEYLLYRFYSTKGAIAQAGANKGDGRPAVEQQVLCCSSQEASGTMLIA